MLDVSLIVEGGGGPRGRRVTFRLQPGGQIDLNDATIVMVGVDANVGAGGPLIATEPRHPASKWWSPGAGATLYDLAAGGAAAHFAVKKIHPMSRTSSPLCLVIWPMDLQSNAVMRFHTGR